MFSSNLQHDLSTFSPSQLTWQLSLKLVSTIFLAFPMENLFRIRSLKKLHLHINWRKDTGNICTIKIPETRKSFALSDTHPHTRRGYPKNNTRGNKWEKRSLAASFTIIFGGIIFDYNGASAFTITREREREREDKVALWGSEKSVFVTKAKCAII